MVVSILVLVGTAATILGVVRRGLVSSNLDGLFIIAGFVLGALTLTWIPFASAVWYTSAFLASFGGPASIMYSTQAQLYQTITWLLVVSLAVPALIFLRCIFPKPIPPEKQRADPPSHRQQGA